MAKKPEHKVKDCNKFNKDFKNGPYWKKKKKSKKIPFIVETKLKACYGKEKIHVIETVIVSKI